MIDVEALPEEIRTTERAVVWNRERRDGKATKVPYQAGRPNAKASVDAPETWGPFDVALRNVEDGKADGAGFVLGGGIVGVDLDDCRDPDTGELEPWAEKIIERVDSYTEVSPSGTGVHIIARGVLPEGRRRRGPIEMYSDGRYFTVTGGHLEDTPTEIHERTGELAALHAETFETNGDGSEDGGRDPGQPPARDLNLSDRQLIEKARNAKNGDRFSRLWAGDTSGYPSQSEADLALCSILAFWARGDRGRIDSLFRQSGLYREKWEREDYRERTIGRALEGRTEFWEPSREDGNGDSRSDEVQEDEESEFGVRDLTHDGLALELGDRWTDARHVAAWGSWYFWNGSTWEEDDTLEHMTRARQFLRERAEGVDDEKDAKKLRSAHTVARVTKLARSNEAQSASVDQWDANPWLLGTPGGTVDLRTGTIRESKPEDYIIKSTSVAPAPEGETSDRWQRFLAEITDGDEKLQAYLQRAAGYCLTGLIKEHTFFFAHGGGANGKGVYTGAMQGVLGDYAATVPTEMLMVNRQSRHPTELAHLRGVRLAVGSETEQGRRWAESRIKSLTGGDTIVARKMRQDFFEFEPQFKLFITGNHRPSLRGVDEAMRRRLQLVPFTVTIPEEKRDKDLPQKLKSEYPAILRWAIAGCLAWQRRGLNPPSSVQDATEEYLDTEDAFALWLEECANTEDPNDFEASSDLYRSWKRWAEQAGEYVGSKKRLSRELQKRDLKKDRGPSGQRGYYGVKLNPSEVPGRSAT